MLPALINGSGLARSSASPMNRMLERFFHDDDFFAPLGKSAWNAMPLSLWEDENHIQLEADLPGLSDKDLDISLDGQELIIRGQRSQETKSNGYDTRNYGQFEQRVTLPMEVDSERAEAKLTNGVLHLTLPKSEQAKPKRIEIKAS